MKKLILVFFVLFLCSGLASVSFAPRVDLGEIENDALTELSGLVLSGWDSQVLWAHNDSGGDNALYALNTSGEHLGVYYAEGLNFRDVEDIAAAEIEGEKYLFVADIGDNNGLYDEIYVYRVLEPQVSAEQSPEEITIPANMIDTIILQYPANLHYDAETVFVDDGSGDIYIVTKRNPDNSSGAEYDLVFKAAYPQDLTGVNYLEEVAVLDLPAYMDYGVTAGDLAPSGRELLLKTYDRVFYWEIPPEVSLSEALDNQGVEVVYELEIQGEALCWSADAEGYYTSSEETGGYPAHLSFYHRLSNYIQINQLPGGLYKSDEELQIIWNPPGLYNQLYLSSEPGGEILDNYYASGIWGEDIITTTPSQLGLSVGIYRGILHNPEYNYLSIEFPILVESENAVQMTYPPNGSTISLQLPVFQWEVNPGVPYYLIGVSDTPFQIEHDEFGEAYVSGIETIWQAICFETSLMYGMPDPSGYFQNAAPPLIPGNEYNWIVINNYGNDPLLSSKVVGNPFAFTFSAQQTIPAVELLTPGYYEPLNTPAINFSWTEVEEAMYYQIQVFEVRMQGSNSGNYLVWDQVTTNTDIEMNAESILIDADYVWKVYATNAAEVSSVSDEGHFSYDIATGTLSLHIRDDYGSPVPFAAAEIDPIDGSSDDFPLAVNENGNEDKTIPVGEYIIEVSKDGFETADTTFTILENETTTLWVELTYSPSYFYGEVVDEQGYLVSNAEIIAECSNGESRSVTAPYGNYLISVVPGNWTIKAEKPGWQLITSRQHQINAGQNIPLQDLVMSESTKNIQGYVRNTGGQSLLRARITAECNGIVYHSISNESGMYNFSGVEFGSYTISAEKHGYTALNMASVEIGFASPEITSADDITLQPASMINGTARNGVVGLKDVTITAIPSMGNSVETLSDEYGDYQLNLLADTYNIGAYKNHYTNQSVYQVTLTTGETLDNLDFVLLPNDAYIRGYISSEGSPLQDVMITAGDSYTYSEANGEFELSVYPGTYNVSAYREGYTVNRSYRLSLSPDEIVENIDFIMYPNASMINGKIHNNGTSIASANVFARKQNSAAQLYSTSSNTEGEYGFSLNHGTYKLWAAKQNFVCLPQDTIFVTVAPGEVFDDADINLTPVEAYINGRIINNQDIGIEGAEVTVVSGDLEYIGISGNYGNFSFTVEPQRSYLVTAAKAGYSSNYAQTDSIGIGEEVFVELELMQLPSTISGRVYNTAGGVVSEAFVTASGDETYNTESGINGSWLLSIFAGDYTLTAAKPGYIEDSYDITLVPGSHLDSLDFYLQENFAILQGYVTNANNSEPIPEVLISANYSGGGGSTAYSDEDGFYHMETLIPGLYESITFTKPGYYGYMQPNQILPGSYTSVLNVELQPFQAAISATVNYLGNAVSGATVSAENMVNGEVISEVTDYSGNCLLSDVTSLVPYQVSVSLTDYTAPDTLIYPIPDDTMEVVFDLIRIDGTISGFISDQNGNPVAAADISAYSQDGFTSTAVSSASGEYMLENLATNRSYEIVVHKTGYSQNMNINVFLTDVPLALDITIYAHIFEITGILQDQEGIPLPGIQIFCQGELAGDEDLTQEDGSFFFDALAPFSVYNFWTLAAEPGYENISWQDSLAAVNLNLGTIEMPVHISRIMGTITDANTAEPIAGAIINAQNMETDHTYSAISQPDGSYRIRYLYAGEYDMEISAQYYETSILDSIWLEHRQDLLLDVGLIYNEPVSISGSVRDTDGRTYSDIPVDLITGATSYSVLTQEDGSFLFNMVPPNSEIIITTDLPPQDYDNAWLQLNTDTQNITNLLLTIDLHNAQINGIVRSDTGLPLASAQLSLTAADTLLTYITTSDGTFNFNNLYEGNYELSCYRPGYDLYNTQITINDYDIIQQEIDLIPVEAAISGIVRSETETGLGNAIVKAWLNGNLAASDTTISSGAFQIQGLPVSEEYLVTVTKLGFASYSYPELLIPGNPPVEINLQFIENSLSGTVYYENLPYPSAAVKIRNLQMELQSTAVNEFGDYLFSNINGYYDVWADAGDSLTSLTASAIIPAGGSQRLHLALVEAAQITGITLYQDNPKPGVVVTAANISSGRWVQDVTEEDGIYQLRGLTAGEYELDYFCNGYQFIDAPQQVTVLGGEIIELPAVNMIFMQNAISGVVQKANTRLGISGALVTLMDSLHIPLDVEVTSGDGTFLFDALPDGLYYLIAEHPAFYEAEEITVTLLDGISEPPVADFNLVPRELIIYGYVRTDNSAPVADAVVTASLQPRLNSPAKRINKRSISDTTDASGYFEIAADTIGVWLLSAQAENFYPAQNIQIELTWQQDYYQQDFYLQPVVLYADLHGSIRILDEIWQPLDRCRISLNSLAGISLTQELNAPDSLYLFADLIIPDVFSLEVDATYNGRQYYELRQNIVIEEEMQLTEDFSFFWVPDTWNLQGNVYMKDAGVIPLENAQIILNAASGDTLMQKTSPAGFYSFNNLPEDYYSLQIQAEYDQENFFYTSALFLLNEDLTRNHYFQYFLAEIGLQVLSPDSAGIANINVNISNEEVNLLRQTNQNGYCSTGPILHTGEYNLSFNPSISDSLVFLAPQERFITLDSLAYYLHQEILPFYFRQQEYSYMYNYDEEIPVTLYNFGSSSAQAELKYRNLNGSLRTIPMAAAGNCFQALIPAQNNSGTIQLWFNVSDSVNAETYDNYSYPLNIEISSAGIPSLQFSTISPQQPILPYNSQVSLNLTVQDELGNNLQDEILENGSVNWTLANGALGSINVNPQNSLQAEFTAAELGIPEISTLITAAVDYEPFYLEVTTDITTGDFYISDIAINGPLELKNGSAAQYNIQILSEQDSPLTLPFEVLSLSPQIGAISVVQNSFVFQPASDYIGRTALTVYAQDPSTEEVFRDSFLVTVYQLIKNDTPPALLNTALDCQVQLYPQMLVNPQSQAKFYLNPRAIPPYEEVDVSTETRSNIFRAASNLSESAYNILPGLSFQNEMQNLMAARWDGKQLSWIIINESEPVIENIPLLKADYSAVINSPSLGIQNLRLLPNPFTPYDVIGSNKGLQITFRLTSQKSRYVKITARIYTLNGELVRELAEAEYMLKGEYNAGEERTLYWNGYTDSGRMARNGRYLVHIIAEDSSGRKEALKPVVLIK